MIRISLLAKYIYRPALLAYIYTLLLGPTNVLRHTLGLCNAGRRERRRPPQDSFPSNFPGAIDC